MADDNAPNNVIPFPVEKVDRVIKLASAIAQLLALSDVDPPEDHLAALMLIQTAIQQAVSREEGPVALMNKLAKANERRRSYNVVWEYRPKK